MIIAYDIVDDRRRDRVAVALQEWGQRIQYSVFAVDGRPASFVRLRATLAALIEADVDSIMFCDLGPRETAAASAVTYLGMRRRLTGDDEALIL